MQAAVAALSRGPVQVSDGVGYSDRSLILRTCDEAGRLLQPSRPATALDAAFHRSAGVGDGPLTRIQTCCRSRRRIRTSAPGNGPIFLRSTSPSRSRSVRNTFVRRTWAPASIAVYEGTRGVGRVSVLGDFRDGVAIPACGVGDFRLYHVAPRLANGWAYLGELARARPPLRRRARGR